MSQFEQWAQGDQSPWATINAINEQLRAAALFARDDSIAGAGGLVLGIRGGVMLVDGVLTTISDQTTTLAGSTTNYIEANRSGTISDNSTGFTAGAIPIATAVTDGSGITTYTDQRAWALPEDLGSRTSFAVTSSDVTLTAAQARCRVLNCTGTLTGNRSVIVPNGPRVWVVTNNTSGSFSLTVKTAAGTGVAVTQGKAATVLADGTNVVLADNDIASGAIADDAVTNAKLANMATQTIKGRTTAGTGDPEDLTAAQATAILRGDGLTVDLAGFRGIPQNSQSAAYTTVAADSGKHILHPAADTNARTFTIDSNANVAYPVGTAITFVNETSQVVTIAITSDTLTLAGTTTTGSRSLAQNGVATALKVTSTKWIISGTGLT